MTSHHCVNNHQSLSAKRIESSSPLRHEEKKKEVPHLFLFTPFNSSLIQQMQSRQCLLVSQKAYTKRSKVWAL